MVYVDVVSDLIMAEEQSGDGSNVETSTTKESTIDAAMEADAVLSATE